MDGATIGYYRTHDSFTWEPTLSMVLATYKRDETCCPLSPLPSIQTSELFPASVTVRRRKNSHSPHMFSPSFPRLISPQINRVFRPDQS